MGKKAKPGKHEIHFVDQESYDRDYVNQVLADSGVEDALPVPEEGDPSPTVSFEEIAAHCKESGVVARKQLTAKG